MMNNSKTTFLFSHKQASTLQQKNEIDIFVNDSIEKIWISSTSADLGKRFLCRSECLRNDACMGFNADTDTGNLWYGNIVFHACILQWKINLLSEIVKEWRIVEELKDIYKTENSRTDGNKLKFLSPGTGVKSWMLFQLLL